MPPLPIRTINLRSEIPQASAPQGTNGISAMVQWYQAETVLLRCSLQALGLPRAIDKDYSVKAIAWQGADLDTLYLNSPGEIISGPGGYIQVRIEPNYSNLPAGSYHLQIKVYDPEGSEMGIGLAAPLNVLPTPNSQNAQYVGTAPSLDLTNYSHPAAAFRFKNGFFQLYNPTTGNWHPIGMFGEAGQEQIVFGDPQP
jgi:hypothetical protein